MMTHRPNCKEILNHLSDYVDGSLEENLCREIEEHLAACPNCRVVVDTLRKTIYLYHETARQPAEVPPAIRERLYRALNIEDYLKH